MARTGASCPVGSDPVWEFPKIRGALSRVPKIRTLVFWGLSWNPFILGNYRVRAHEVR